MKRMMIALLGLALWASQALAWKQGNGVSLPVPVISAVSSGSPSSNGATITWTTSISASSQVFYGAPGGPANVYGSSTTLDATLLTSHSQPLSSLTASSTYHFKVESIANGHTVDSADQTFTTAGAGVACPFTGAPAVDGCSGATGIYFAPAVNVQGDGWSITKPTAAQFAAYAANSGQAWASNHPQPYNLAGIDYGIGPSQTVASLTDIAYWTPGVNNCTYLPDAAGGVPASFSMTAAASGSTTFTLTTNVGGTPLAPGMQLQATNGSANNVIVTSYVAGTGGGNSQAAGAQWNTSIGIGHSETNQPFNAYDYPQQIPSWPTTAPAAVASFVCYAATSANFTVSGYNLGPYAFQGTPHPSNHGCVEPVIQAANAASPKITFANDAFINGPGCAFSSTTNMFLLNLPFLGELDLIGNFIDGRVNDVGACCLLSSTPSNSGGLIGGKSEGVIIEEYNYEINVGGSNITFVSGNEAAYPCSNGETNPILIAPGYNLISKWNFYPMGADLGGAGHWEHATFAASGNGTICSYVNDYNVGTSSGTLAAQNSGAYFGFTTDFGSIERMEVIGNTLVSNIAATKQFPEFYDYANWYTTGGSPNYLITTGDGSSCANIPWPCSGVTAGEIFSAGTNNTYNSQILPNGVSAAGPIPSSRKWTAGCGNPDTGGVLCPSTGIVTLTPNIAVPTPVTSQTASSTVSSGSSVPLTGGSCATAATVQGGIANANLFDTQTGTDVWIGAIGSCAAGTLTLVSPVAATVTAGDTLKIQNQVLNGAVDNRQGRLAAFISHGSKTYFTATAGSTGPYTGSTVDLTAAACTPNIAGSILVDMQGGLPGVQIGVIQSCSNVSGHAILTLYSYTGQITGYSVANGDALTILGYSYGHLVGTGNYLDAIGTGAGPTGAVASPWNWSTSLIFSSGSVGFTSGIAGGGCVLQTTFSGNIDLKAGTAATTQNISSGSYNQTTGLLTYNLAGAPWGAVPPATAAGSFVTVAGVAVASGSSSSLNGLFQVLTITNSGTTVTLLSNGTAAMGSTAGGTLSQATPYPQVNVFSNGAPGSITGGC